MLGAPLNLPNKPTNCAKAKIGEIPTVGPQSPLYRAFNWVYLWSDREVLLGQTGMQWAECP